MVGGDDASPWRYEADDACKRFRGRVPSSSLHNRESDLPNSEKQIGSVSVESPKVKVDQCTRPYACRGRVYANGAQMMRLSKTCAGPKTFVEKLFVKAQGVPCIYGARTQQTSLTGFQPALTACSILDPQVGETQLLRSSANVLLTRGSTKPIRCAPGPRRHAWERAEAALIGVNNWVDV